MDVTKEFLQKVFAFSNLEEKYVHILTDRIAMYQTAFTSPSVDPDNNYELFEKLGDKTANEVLVWYFYTVFPQLQCPAGVKVIAALGNVYGSSAFFSKFAEMLGFWPYVKATEDELKSDEKRQKLLEDVFEAFIGVTKLIFLQHFGFYGVGNEVAYSIMKPLLDSQEISLEEEALYDAKTRLKELFDKSAIMQQFGRVKYEYAETGGQTLVNLYFVRNNAKKLIASGTGLKKAAEKEAAAKAIKYLQDNGVVLEKRAKLFCVNE